MTIPDGLTPSLIEYLLDNYTEVRLAANGFLDAERRAAQARLESALHDILQNAFDNL